MDSAPDPGGHVHIYESTGSGSRTLYMRLLNCRTRIQIGLSRSTLSLVAVNLPACPVCAGADGGGGTHEASGAGCAENAAVPCTVLAAIHAPEPKFLNF
jgi:hypothetical protein